MNGRSTDGSYPDVASIPDSTGVVAVGRADEEGEVVDAGEGDRPRLNSPESPEWVMRRRRDMHATAPASEWGAVADPWEDRTAPEQVSGGQDGWGEAVYEAPSSPIDAWAERVEQQVSPTSMSTAGAFDVAEREPWTDVTAQLPERSDGGDVGPGPVSELDLPESTVGPHTWPLRPAESDVVIDRDGPASEVELTPVPWTADTVVGDTDRRTASEVTDRIDAPTSAPVVAPVPAPSPTVVPAPTSAREEPPVPAQVNHTRAEARSSFLQHDVIERRPSHGLPGMISRVGIRVSPGRAERAEREDERAVSQHWPGPRTIAIVNGKGGSGKTPTTVMLSATFARFGGAGVLAWDNNQTRGTLGWRTENAPHEGTVLDLLPQAERLLGPSAQAADLAHFVHHQTRDRFDVLRSKPVVLANQQRVGAEDIDAIHAVAAKYYRLIFVDSGNDESDPMWSRMIDLADQIVVATTTRADHAEAGALLLEDLAARDEHGAKLVEGAVVVLNQADPKATRADVQRVADGFSGFTRAVARIPFDAGLVDGRIVYENLRPVTRRAWLAAGSAIAAGLSER